MTILTIILLKGMNVFILYLTTPGTTIGYLVLRVCSRLFSYIASILYVISNSKPFRSVKNCVFLDVSNIGVDTSCFNEDISIVNENCDIENKDKEMLRQVGTKKESDVYFFIYIE